MEDKINILNDLKKFEEETNLKNMQKRQELTNIKNAHL